MADFKMAEINYVALAGNLTRDPIYRVTQNGNAFIHFTVAANRRYRDSSNNWQEEVSFVGIVARSKLAESCYQHLKQGSGVLIEGELQSRKWKSEEGHVQRIVEIKARRIQFLTKPGSQEKSATEEITSSADLSTDSDDITLKIKQFPAENERSGVDGLRFPPLNEEDQ
jgi:single-strand DNA-binding protein